MSNIEEKDIQHNVELDSSLKSDSLIKDEIAKETDSKSDTHSSGSVEDGHTNCSEGTSKVKDDKQDDLDSEDFAKEADSSANKNNNSNNGAGASSLKDDEQVSYESESSFDLFHTLEERSYVSEESEELFLYTPTVLEEITLDGIISYIKAGKAKNIITMVGAGISTAAGIPDFRSPTSGIYHHLHKYDLPYPQAIFELYYFYDNPEPFFALAKTLLPEVLKQPTKSHYLIKLLAEKNMLLRHYTQNIDNLERRAGIDEEFLVEAHGSFNTSHCIDCKRSFDFNWMKEKVSSEPVPKCVCGGIVKPDIVFFGESLPKRFFQKYKDDFSKCDLLLIMGSSLVVEPFGSLCCRVKITCPRLLVNNERVGHGHGLKYGSKSNFRDVAWIGNCEDFSDEFVKKLGWTDEFNRLLEGTGHRVKD